jgi:hypothetical protein
MLVTATSWAARRRQQQRLRQDNAITWVDWATSTTNSDVRPPGRRAARRAPVFRRRRFFTGHPVRQIGSTGLPDISWFRPDGSEMTEADWDTAFDKSIAVYLNGQGIPDLDPRGTGSPTTHSDLFQCALRADPIHLAASRFRHAGGRPSWTLPPPPPPTHRTASRRCSRRAVAARYRRDRWWSCRPSAASRCPRHLRPIPPPVPGRRPRDPHQCPRAVGQLVDPAVGSRTLGQHDGGAAGRNPAPLHVVYAGLQVSTLISPGHSRR